MQSNLTIDKPQLAATLLFDNWFDMRVHYESREPSVDWNMAERALRDDDLYKFFGAVNWGVGQTRHRALNLDILPPQELSAFDISILQALAGSFRVGSSLVYKSATDRVIAYIVLNDELVKTLGEDPEA